MAESKIIEIVAKFPSMCAKCGKRVPAGSTVFWDRPNRKVYCPDCSGEATPTVEVKKAEGTTEVEIDLDKVRKIVNDEIEKTTTTTMDSKKKEIQKGIVDEIAAAKKRVKDDLEKEFGVIPKRIIVIEEKGKPPKKIKEITNVKVPDIITMVQADIPVFLIGEAGCGKNHMVQQIATALGMEFYFSNAITNEYKITGFVDAGGKYHETQFFEAFTKGGLFFFDEVDASIPEVLVLLNAAIENRYFNFPHGKFYAHPDFRIISAGNTYGTGANQQYVGRYQLDAASLDRFVMVEVTYDEDVESIISNGDKELVEAVHTLRKVTAECGIKIILSYRAINQINKLHNVKKLAIEDVMKYVIVKGMSVDDQNIIKPKIKTSTNKYLVALCGVMK